MPLFIFKFDSHIALQQWDQTISNFVVKTGIGLSVGIVASALLFKSKYKVTRHALVNAFPYLIALNR